MRSGPLDALGDAPDALGAHPALVPWAIVPGLPHAPRAPAASSGLGLLDALRQTPRAPLATQRRVQHRRFAHELALELSLAQAGAAWIRSPAELASVRARLADPRGACVLKSPYSAAGQGHWHLAPGETPEPARLEQQLRRHGGLLHEVWEERRDDFGVAGWVDAAGTPRLAGAHTLGVDARGRFRSVRAAAPGAPPGELGADVLRQLVSVFAQLGEALARTGYRGPFGLDAYRTAEGRLRPLVELNARLGFGLLTHALAERLRDAGRLAPDEGLELRLFGHSERPDRGVHAERAATSGPAAPRRWCLVDGGSEQAFEVRAEPC